ncbi:MAG: hypothetical protein EZS28_018442, partial [Streblomastix strix]
NGSASSDKHSKGQDLFRQMAGFIGLDDDTVVNLIGKERGLKRENILRKKADVVLGKTLTQSATTGGVKEKKDLRKIKSHVGMALGMFAKSGNVLQPQIIVVVVRNLELERSGNAKYQTVWSIGKLSDHIRETGLGEGKVLMRMTMALIVTFSGSRMSEFAAMMNHFGKGQEANIWRDFGRNRVLCSLGCSSDLKELIIQAELDDKFGGNVIRHSKMTKLRQERASLEQVNEFTRHAPGSSVVDRFYNKPEKAEDLDSLLLKECGLIIYMDWWAVVGDGVNWKQGMVGAGVDGDWFGSNSPVGFETEPEPINHSTVFLMKLKVSNTY